MCKPMGGVGNYITGLLSCFAMALATGSFSPSLCTASQFFWPESPPHRNIQLRETTGLQWTVSVGVSLRRKNLLSVLCLIRPHGFGETFFFTAKLKNVYRKISIST